MKPTDKNIALYFGTTRQSLGNWKNSEDEALKRRYEALRYWFVMQTHLDSKKKEWEDGNNNSN